MLTEEQKKEILKLARTTIESYIKEGMIPRFETADPVLKQKMGAFVTIHNNEKLRGCIGLIESDQMLYETIIEMAIQASRNDPRFEPVSAKELDETDIEVSVLSKPRRINGIEEFELGKHGIIIKKGYVSGVYLPQVAKETGWTKEEFLENLCESKAGLPRQAYKEPGVEVYVFEAEVFGEKDRE